MARTALPVHKVTSAGIDVTAVAEAANVDGNSIPLTEGLTLVVTNGDAAAKQVTIPTPLAVDGLDVAERVVSVPAGEQRFLALGANRAYRQPDGSAHVDYDDVTSVTVALLHVR